VNLALDIPVGSRVTKVYGVRVDDYVRSRLGTRYLPYDPEYGKLHDHPRLHFDRSSPTLKVELITPDNRVIAAEVPWSTELWDAPYPNRPPARTTEPGSHTLTKELVMSVIEWDGKEVGYIYVPPMPLGFHGDTQKLIRGFLTANNDLSSLIIDFRNTRFTRDDRPEKDILRNQTC
jgi:hypothetical protein